MLKKRFCSDFSYMCNTKTLKYIASFIHAPLTTGNISCSEVCLQILVEIYIKI